MKVGKKRNPVGVNGKLLNNHVVHIGILWQNIQIVANLSDEMSSLKTEIRRLEAEIIADKNRMKEEQTRSILESIVEF